jgi:hypothetical protein
MSEPKIHPLIPLISSSKQIMLLLLRSPTVPNPLPSTILPNIIPLCPSIEHQIQRNNPNENFIPPSIIRRIISSVDVGRNDIAGLNAHVIEGRGNCTGADTVGVTGLEGDLDCMDIGVTY